MKIMGNHRRNKTFQIFLIVGIIALLSFAVHVKLASTQMKLKAKGIELCALCHPDLKKKFNTPVQHTPVKEGDCTGCHNPHAAKNKHLLGQPGAGLCYECHEKEKKQYQQPHIHTPIQRGECVGCHNPHGSENKFSLVKKGSDLCFSCHAEEKSLQKARKLRAKVGYYRFK